MKILPAIALACLVAGAFSLSIIQLRRTALFGTRRSVLQPLDTKDKQLIKIALLLILGSIVAAALHLFFGEQ